MEDSTISMLAEIQQQFVEKSSYQVTRVMVLHIDHRQKKFHSFFHSRLVDRESLVKKG